MGPWDHGTRNSQLEPFRTAISSNHRITLPTRKSDLSYLFHTHPLFTIFTISQLNPSGTCQLAQYTGLVSHCNITLANSSTNIDAACSLCYIPNPGLMGRNLNRICQCVLVIFPLLIGCIPTVIFIRINS